MNRNLKLSASRLELAGDADAVDSFTTDPGPFGARAWLEVAARTVAARLTSRAPEPLF